MKTGVSYRFLVASVTTVIALYAVAAAAVSQSVFLSPSGDDAYDGLSAARPVATFQRALDAAAALSAASGDTVMVLVFDGVYLRQTGKTRGLLHRRKLEIRPLNVDRARPQFDGGGEGGTWLAVRNARGAPTSISIHGLEIANYETAISLDGNRNDSTRWNGENEIRDNVFRSIGQIARHGAKPSTAAIRLVNSDRNHILRNRFATIRNHDGCSHLHAIYAAHDSSDNLIEGNTFEDGCGDAIRFRDSSGRNVVRGNTFVDAWDKAPVSDWYCNPRRRDGCTKAWRECPSLGNLVEGNRVVARRMKAPPQTALSYGSDLVPECPEMASEARFVVR